jgi:hypothetical protein
MKIFESLGLATPSDDVTRNRHQLSSRMIMSGFTINARRAGRKLAIVTTPANAIGAALISLLLALTLLFIGLRIAGSG